MRSTIVVNVVVLFYVDMSLHVFSSLWTEGDREILTIEYRISQVTSFLKGCGDVIWVSCIDANLEQFPVLFPESTVHVLWNLLVWAAVGP